jgi:hypothetical protein
VVELDNNGNQSEAEETTNIELLPDQLNSHSYVAAKQLMPGVANSCALTI